MGNLAIESKPYEPPEGLMDLGDRSADGKKFFLYVGERTFVDVVEVKYINDKEELGSLITRVEGTPDKALDLLEHTSLFMPEDEASRIFGKAA